MFTFDSQNPEPVLGVIILQNMLSGTRFPNKWFSFTQFLWIVEPQNTKDEYKRKWLRRFQRKGAGDSFSARGKPNKPAERELLALQF